MNLPDLESVRKSIDPEFDIRKYLFSGDPIQRHFDINRLNRDKWQWKNAVSRLLLPKAIVEIGVRAGYSASAFLRGSPTAKYLGLDNDSDTHGGKRGYSLRAIHRMKKDFPLAEVMFVNVDTQDEHDRAQVQEHVVPDFIETSGIQAVDFVHVDADHTEEGCLNDLLLAEMIVGKGAGFILVDDYVRSNPVHLAVQDFLSRRGYTYLELPTYQGDALIQIDLVGDK